MKKFVSGIAAAALLAAGGVALEGATVASNASVVAAADSYGPTKAEVTKTITKIIDAIKDDKISPNKAAKFINKLRAARDAGVIGQAKFKKLKKKIKRAI